MQHTEAFSAGPQFVRWQYICEESPLAPYGVTKCTTQLPGSHGVLDDDPDVLLLSDPDSSGFNSLEIDYEDCYDVEESDGVHLGQDAEASQIAPTLLVTCPHHLEKEKCERGEARLIMDVDDFLDGQCEDEEWERDGILLIDF